MSLNLQFDEPVQMALTRTDSKHYPTRYRGQEDRLMYSVVLADGTEDKLFLPESTGETIRERGLQVGEIFTITRRKTKQRGEYYQLSPRTQPAAEPPSKLESQLAASISHAQAQRAAPRPQGFDDLPTSVPQSQRTSPSTVSPAAKPGPTLVDREQPNATATGHTTLSQLMSGCMVAAIDAASVGRDYAHAKGLTLSFDQCSIERIAVALLIRTEKQAAWERDAMIAGNRSVAGAQWQQ